jgi:competence ComEA-like helix-hairpin-helix protein
MLSSSERRVLIFIIVVLFVGSAGGFLRPTPVQETEKDEELISFPININTATAEELILLPNIGEVMAKRIVVYRIRNNGFKTKEEIMNVKGIGKVKFEKIKDKICIE